MAGYKPSPPVLTQAYLCARELTSTHAWSVCTLQLIILTTLFLLLLLQIVSTLSGVFLHGILVTVLFSLCIRLHGILFAIIVISLRIVVVTVLAGRSIVDIVVIVIVGMQPQFLNEAAGCVVLFLLLQRRTNGRVARLGSRCRLVGRVWGLGLRVAGYTNRNILLSQLSCCSFAAYLGHHMQISSPVERQQWARTSKRRKLCNTNPRR